MLSMIRALQHSHCAILSSIEAIAVVAKLIPSPRLDYLLPVCAYTYCEVIGEVVIGNETNRQNSSWGGFFVAKHAESRKTLPATK